MGRGRLQPGIQVLLGAQSALTRSFTIAATRGFTPGYPGRYT